MYTIWLSFLSELYKKDRFNLELYTTFAAQKVSMMQTKFTVVLVLLVVVAKFVALGSTKGIIQPNEAKLKALFITSDTNGDGFISADELKKAITSYNIYLTVEEFAGIYRESDIDGDGKINFKEIVAAFMKLNLLAHD